MGIYTNTMRAMLQHIPTDCVGYINHLMHTNEIKSIDISSLNLVSKGEKVVKVSYVDKIGVRISTADGFQWKPIDLGLSENAFVDILSMVEDVAMGKKC